MTGFEPATLGTTNRCSNQLSYNHRVLRVQIYYKSLLLQRKKNKNYIKFSKLLTAKCLSAVNPSAKSVPIKRPRSCDR